jgi:hypothetical protein
VEKRRAMLRTAVYIGAFLLAMQLGTLATAAERDTALTRVARDAEPLTRALRQCYADYGAYPDRLSELVPEYLPAVPRPSLGLAPGFHYASHAPWMRADEDDCMLLVTYRTAAMADSLVWVPSGRLPDAVPPEWARRVGEWRAVAGVEFPKGDEGDV